MKSATKHLVRAAVIGGVYAALCFLLQPFSYGAVQIRFSEMLTILPVFTPDAIWGLTIGCFISNMLSYSPIDMIFGTLATLVSAICTYKLANIRFKNLPILATIPPVLINAVVVGLEITYIFMPESASISVLLLNMLSVAIGQMVSCVILGLALFDIVKKAKPLNQFFSD
ncbi:MAG: QueT transporter family protein [Oscillospiraceae bacterium]